MKTWKLVAGILSIVFCTIVLFQSCAVGIVNMLEESGDTGGSVGLFVALYMLAGGIISIATRGSTEKGGNIALIILFILAAIIAFSNAAVYKDLTVWAIWCLMNAGIAIVAIVKK